MTVKLPRWANNSDKFSLFLLLFLVWAIAYSIFGDEHVGVNSVIFRLAVVFIVAKLAGCLLGLIRIPPMIGMLLIGVLMRNVGFIEIVGDYAKFTSVLRQLALVNILLPAGLGLDANALRQMGGMIANLAVVPVAIEVVGITILAHLTLDFPWLWGSLLGLLLAAVSPAVIIPCLFELQDLGYGVDKGIHTLVIAASTLNDILCIAIFGVMLGIIFSTQSLLMQIFYGPIIFAMGFAFGAALGFVCQHVPHKDETYVTTLRTLLLGLGCVLAALGSNAIGYMGAGPLGCMVAAFVASFIWKKQGWSSNNPVKANFVLLWKFFEPISFALIGVEVNFSILETNTVTWGLLVLCVPLLLRILTSFATTQCSNLNVKEKIFVALSWIPKATVQATLGPTALVLARNLNDPVLEGYANSVVIIAVISIIITSPIGAILIMQLGPKLLKRTKTVHYRNFGFWLRMTVHPQLDV
uniref:Cation/H+ exchanger transmembrane domain-containing protein n=1 Tax=Photinus pyralis TaxID=7054 RepID=A0A1Y1MAZ5_PHOPY